VRIWSLIDLVPKVVAFQKADPAVIERASRPVDPRSLLRMPLNVVTCVACSSLCGGGMNGKCSRTELLANYNELVANTRRDGALPLRVGREAACIRPTTRPHRAGPIRPMSAGELGRHTGLAQHP